MSNMNNDFVVFLGEQVRNGKKTLERVCELFPTYADMVKQYVEEKAGIPVDYIPEE